MFDYILITDCNHNGFDHTQISCNLYMPILHLFVFVALLLFGFWEEKKVAEIGGIDYVGHDCFCRGWTLAFS